MKSMLNTPARLILPVALAFSLGTAGLMAQAKHGGEHPPGKECHHNKGDWKAKKAQMHERMAQELGLSPEQRSQVRRIAQLGKSGGTLDYVAPWFIRAGEYLAANRRVKVGFVATNSITQGEQVAQEGLVDLGGGAQGAQHPQPQRQVHLDAAGGLDAAEVEDVGVPHLQQQSLDDGLRRGVVAGHEDGVVAVAVLSALMLAPGPVVEVLWMRALGFEAVFWKVLLLKTALFAAAFVLTAAFLGVNFYVVLRHFPVLRWLNLEEGRGPLRVGDVQVTPGALRTVAVGLTGFLALLFGMRFAGAWDAFVRYGGELAYGRVDPIFGNDLAFYLLRLPIRGLLGQRQRGRPHRARRRLRRPRRHRRRRLHRRHVELVNDACRPFSTSVRIASSPGHRIG